MRCRDNKGYTILEFVFVLMVVLQVVLAIGVIVVSVSLVTSAVKVGAKDCGKTYGIEGIIKGDWFCPK